jgi:hypothetical protein
MYSLYLLDVILEICIIVYNSEDRPRDTPTIHIHVHVPVEIPKPAHLFLTTALILLGTAWAFTT